MNNAKFPILILAVLIAFGSPLNAQLIYQSPSDNILPQVTLLRIINQSKDQESGNFVMMQKNLLDDQASQPTFWHTYVELAPGADFPLQFDHQVELTGIDGKNYACRRLKGLKGKQVSYINDKGTKKLIVTGKAENPNRIEFINGMKEETVKAGIYRSGKRLSLIKDIRPREVVAFEFDSKILIGHIPEWKGYPKIPYNLPGKVGTENIQTELDMEGIFSADIVIRGGGDEPYTYHLENVVRD